MIKRDGLDKLYLLADFLIENEITIVKTVNENNKLCTQIAQKTVLDANRFFREFEMEEEINGNDIYNDKFNEL